MSASKITYQDGDQVVTGTEVVSSQPINYDKLIEQFGSSRIDDQILTLLNQVIEKRGLEASRDKYLAYFRRGIFFSHRDFGLLLTNYLKGSQFYIYTGRGPSSESMHIGHLIPFKMAQLLQELFDVPVVIQLTDDEKYYYSKDKKLKLSDFTRMGYENIKDILACGFNPEKTFTFLNTEYMQYLYPTVVQIQKLVNLNTIQSIFGLGKNTETNEDSNQTQKDSNQTQKETQDASETQEDTNQKPKQFISPSIGKVSFPAIQAAPSFSCCFPNFLSQEKPLPCLIPCAIDQDPYFRMTRDIAKQMGYPKPVLLHAKFLPSLLGVNAKMSSSIADSVIFLSESDKSITKKINKCFSGGGDTEELQRKNGANLEVDVPTHYLQFFLDNETEYREICQLYGKGQMLTGEVKKLTIQTVLAIVQKHREARKALIK
jgi:tryptophanyl-tRNA synthetase